jgi:REP element-mobilizing transposase RayT
MSPSLPIRTFDRADEYFVVERRDLPHWSQAGTLAFITWRTWDSIPRPVMARLLTTRAQWLRQHGIDASNANWRRKVADLRPREQIEFAQLVSKKWEDSLDQCHGACVLRRPELSEIVASSLHYDDGKRYRLTDFVVMPNHVHLLAAFPTADAMLEQVESWKHYTAVRINRFLKRRGRFWEVDDFDHLVRSEEQFAHYRKYIADNPFAARLRPGEFRHYSAALDFAE